VKGTATLLLGGCPRPIDSKDRHGSTELAEVRPRPEPVPRASKRCEKEVWGKARLGAFGLGG